ncbi:UDP-N-acetylglucosamine 2-epimerase (non-hydrolyzing) [Modestobacter sp. VKM Ac-2986]|uniref:non-hydrolyzing UDP-N-acetylglucosamine 2-epimerase n=1 Tax=Modestobacter sp. VKM Ac-2986 TaxID=3004140 RepID=UPI0022AB3E7B|nr:UDP-N-acetylglucosamine 2-epimerase (non-hydrolyzing) [Modestobacter sp. VKM Ac-2986]MCZ2827827.1 UDP-N-acetylglucosamine 2-epimerase (non-hydrolyzing) [Modestobacter sp. VKM Ac-2986]
MSRSRHVLVPFGTRPEVVKLAPVVAALVAAGHRVDVVDTGQHADAAMASQLQEALGLTPTHRFSLPTEPASARTGALHADAATALARFRPDLVLALGDTNTVPAYALAARGAGVPFAHVEAGLRSYNMRSVEEVNRRVAAAIAQLHLAPTARAADSLLREGVPAERVFVVGNPVIDTLVTRGVTPLPVAERAGVLVTAHRPTNVDDPVRLARLVAVVRGLAERVGPVTFPVHPRTTARLAAAGLTGALDHPGITLTGPVDHDTLMGALRASALAVTDSGGVQEEAAHLGVPVVVLRSSTPRWEGVEAGTTTLAGLTDDGAAEAVLAAAAAHTSAAGQARAAALPCPYGDGTTGAQVAAILADERTDALLELTEPDFTDGRLPW